MLVHLISSGESEGAKAFAASLALDIQDTLRAAWEINKIYPSTNLVKEDNVSEVLTNIAKYNAKPGGREKIEEEIANLGADDREFI